MVQVWTKVWTNEIFNILNILQVVGVTGMAGVAQLVELWIVIPMPPSNINDLAPKTVRTSGSSADEMRTI